MRCPDCQTELPPNAEVCPRCFAVLATPADPLDLWEEQREVELSTPEILTSAARTGDVNAAEARLAVAQARAARREPPGGQRRPIPPTGPQPTIPRPPPPAAGRGRPPATGPLQAARRMTGAPPRAPSVPGVPPAVTGPVQRLPELGGQPEPARRSFGVQAEIATHIVSGDPEAARGTQIVEISLPAAVKQARRGPDEKPRSRRPAEALAVEESGVSRGVDESIASWRLLYSRMHALDRWSFWALLAAWIGCFLPWAHVRGEGLVAGIQELHGVGAAALAMLAVGCLLMRTWRRRLGGVLLLLQLIITAAVGASAVYVLFTAVEVQFSAGPFVTTAGAGAAVMLTLMRLARPGS